MAKFISELKLRVYTVLLQLKCKLNPAGMTRKYLQEWRDEQEYSDKHCGEPGFSWHWHDKELFSIQNAIRFTYGQMDNKKRDALTKEEREEIETILNYEIID